MAQETIRLLLRYFSSSTNTVPNDPWANKQRKKRLPDVAYGIEKKRKYVVQSPKEKSSSFKSYAKPTNPSSYAIIHDLAKQRSLPNAHEKNPTN
jgi:hypothetical protein